MERLGSWVFPTEMSCKKNTPYIYISSFFKLGGGGLEKQPLESSPDKNIQVKDSWRNFLRKKHGVMMKRPWEFGIKLTADIPGIEKILLELENRSKKHTEATVGSRLVGFFWDQFLEGLVERSFFLGGGWV